MSDITGKTAVVIVGPTASGKTAASLALARQWNTSIISADSRQCYREMNIGVAKPTPAELDLVHHDFINAYSIHDHVDTHVFEKDALAAAEKAFALHDKVIVTGGTGLYVKVFCEGIDALPAIDPAVRQQVRDQPRTVKQLQEWIAQIDPAYWRNTTEPDNPVRLMRALEVKLSTGQSIQEFQTGGKKTRDFNIIKYGILWPREELYERINQRVDHMFDAGLVEEATALYPYRHLNALQTVGYQEIFDYLEKRCTLEEAREKIKQHTRNYAKRQMTWFRKDPAIQWRPFDRIS